MSLTSHLDEKNSPVRRFIREEFSNTKPFLADARKQIKAANTIRPDTNTNVPWRDIGRDGRYLVRSFFKSLDTLLCLCQPVAGQLPVDWETSLNRHCFVLSLFEEVYRAGLSDNSPLVKRTSQSVDDLLGIAESTWLDDLCRLSWRFYDGFNHLIALPHELNPVFEGAGDVGGADGDLIIDGTLVDIKTTTTPQIKPDYIWQLLGYTLLDYSDRYQIDSIGLYMARQGVLLKWSLEDAIAKLCSGKPESIGELRKRFKKLVNGPG